MESGAASDEPRAARGTWGLWATLALTGAIVLGFIATQSLVLIPFAMVKGAQEGISDPAAFAENLAANGNLVALGLSLSAPLACILIWACIRVRGGPGVREYLSLRVLSGRAAAVCVVLTLVFAAGYDLLTVALGRPIVPEVMQAIYESASLKPLLWLAMVVLAPVMEESLFRGFLWAGLQDSWLGQTGTILIASIVWSVLHVQYDLYQVTSIFVLGLVLGYARAITGSLYACILIHVLVNFIATIETAWAAG